MILTMENTEFAALYKEGLEPLINKIGELLSAKAQIHEKAQKTVELPVMIAIDGPCGAGKSTLGAWIKSEYDCNLFHMDDFFLQPNQRTRERLDTPGENVDHERFFEEILKPAYEGKPVKYRRFDCKTMTIQEAQIVSGKPLAVIEGSYSLHPSLRDYYDLKVYLDITSELQLERIRKRNSPQAAEMFVNKWIPMENKYFETYGVKNTADIVIESELLILHQKIN